MVARDGVEPPTPAFSATLCCVLNNLSDFRWPPKYLRSRERHENRGWKSWVQWEPPPRIKMPWAFVCPMTITTSVTNPLGRNAWQVRGSHPLPSAQSLLRSVHLFKSFA